MNFKGGCCIARYGGGGPGGVYDMSKVDRIMLRFRPIAPRPATGGSSSPPEKNGSAIVCTKSGRGKRKYSKENSNSGGSVVSNGNSKRCNKRRREEKKDGSGGGAAEIVTLPLLPETPERKDSPSPARGFTCQPDGNPTELSAAPFWLSFGNGRSDGLYQTAADSDLTEVITARTETVRSCVTVECITDTWVEAAEYGLGCTDEERKMNLERDMCPGFISDGGGRVTWTNGAYRDLVGSSRMTVWLVMRERPMLTYPAFTCRVRLEYTCRDKERSSITLPCDVWRMNDGGFAWRLDVNAALCLGR